MNSTNVQMKNRMSVITTRAVEITNIKTINFMNVQI